VIEQKNILVRGAHAVMTGRADGAQRSSASDVRIVDGVIAEMGQNLPPRQGERMLDARDCVVYPGWVNTHHHLFQSLLKGVPAGLNRTLGPWLEAVPFRFKSVFDEKSLRLAARIGLVELVLSGCTTVADHHYLFGPDIGYDASAILFEEAERLGMRFMLLRGGATVTRPSRDPAVPNARMETLDEMLADVARAVSRFHQTGPRTRRRVALAPTTANLSLRPQEMKLVAIAARRMGIRLHTHMSESVAAIEQCRTAFGCSPIEYLAEHDWLGPNTFLAHAVHLSDHDIELLGQTGTGIAHCPQSNARLADGIAPIGRLRRMGARISLGVDGAASNEAADMLSEVHFCWLVHRALAGSLARPRPEAAGEEGADATQVEEVIHWATAGGAQVLGFEGVGTLEVGQAADLAVYDLDAPRYFGLHDMAIGPVVCAGRPRLKWLLADGRVIVSDDRLPSIDLAQLRAEAWAATRQLAAAAGG
jgi:8-oxoguanine deaminase